MRCINNECSKRKYCEKVHELNGYKLNEQEGIMIPNYFYYELNKNNRFAKQGVSKEGFVFGCKKLIETKEDKYSFFINDVHIVDFDYMELLNDCNRVFSEMVNSGEIKIAFR